MTRKKLLVAALLAVVLWFTWEYVLIVLVAIILSGVAEIVSAFSAGIATLAIMLMIAAVVAVVAGAVASAKWVLRAVLGRREDPEVE